MKTIVRIIRTFEVEVPAEYGDTEESLIEKAQVNKESKYTETKVVLPNTPSKKEDK